MTRARVLSIVTGVAALTFSPLAMADDEMKATGGEGYGGAPLEEDTTQEPLTPAEEVAPVEQPAEGMSPTGGAEYGSPMGGSEYGVMGPLEPTPEPVEVEEEIYPAFGMSVSAGGGVIGFVDDGATEVVDTGGAWDARLVIGTRSIIGVEAAYVGSAQGMSALGLDDNAVLTGNGLEALARLNLGSYTLQPYLLAGVGWTRYDIVNEDFNTSSIEDQDDVLTVPFGAGFNARLGGGFILDGRFTYRATFDDSMFDRVVVVDGDINVDDGSNLDNWAATAHVGYEF